MARRRVGAANCRGLKRSPLRPRDRIRAAGPKPEKRDLDRLCREVVFLRDGHRCRRCERVANLQWCHVYTRRVLSVRWDLDNSFAGCAGCHLWWHHNPVDAAAWWEKEIGPVRMAALRARRWRSYKTDLLGVRVLLERERARFLQGGK